MLSHQLSKWSCPVAGLQSCLYSTSLAGDQNHSPIRQSPPVLRVLCGPPCVYSHSTQLLGGARICTEGKRALRSDFLNSQPWNTEKQGEEWGQGQCHLGPGILLVPWETQHHLPKSSVLATNLLFSARAQDRMQGASCLSSPTGHSPVTKSSSHSADNY